MTTEIKIDQTKVYPVLVMLKSLVQGEQKVMASLRARLAELDNEKAHVEGQMKAVEARIADLSTSMEAVERSHLPPAPPLPPEPPMNAPLPMNIECPICKRRFPYRSYLIRHVNRSHRGHPDFGQVVTEAPLSDPESLIKLIRQGIANKMLTKHFLSKFTSSGRKHYYLRTLFSMLPVGNPLLDSQYRCRDLSSLETAKLAMDVSSLGLPSVLNKGTRKEIREVILKMLNEREAQSAPRTP